MVLVSAALFIVAVPFARVSLPQFWAIIPVNQSALAINDLITAALLFTQFSILRTRALRILAGGSLFTAGMVVVHGLTFPGLFRPTGLLSAGPPTTAWLYLFWHGGFPIAVIAYARMKDEKTDGAAQPSVGLSILCGIGAVCAAIVGLALLATAGHALLPAMMRENGYAPALTVVVPAVCLLTAGAPYEVWRKARYRTRRARQFGA